MKHRFILSGLVVVVVLALSAYSCVVNPPTGGSLR